MPSARGHRHGWLRCPAPLARPRGGTGALPAARGAAAGTVPASPPPVAVPKADEWVAASLGKRPPPPGTRGLERRLRSRLTQRPEEPGEEEEEEAAAAAAPGTLRHACGVPGRLPAAVASRRVPAGRGPRFKSQQHPRAPAEPRPRANGRRAAGVGGGPEPRGSKRAFSGAGFEEGEAGGGGAGGHCALCPAAFPPAAEAARQECGCRRRRWGHRPRWVPGGSRVGPRWVSPWPRGHRCVPVGAVAPPGAVTAPVLASPSWHRGCSQQPPLRLRFGGKKQLLEGGDGRGGGSVLPGGAALGPAPTGATLLPTASARGAPGAEPGAFWGENAHIWVFFRKNGVGGWGGRGRRQFRLPHPLVTGQRLPVERGSPGSDPPPQQPRGWTRGLTGSPGEGGNGEPRGYRVAWGRGVLMGSSGGTGQPGGGF